MMEDALAAALERVLWMLEASPVFLLAILGVVAARR